ncbi:Pomgnt1 [Symbiodinium necroappetens]|uniref:Pomgnt1 protein n=1 Tax=Symbiodinium necroappetens TaxID=1628268 RepID=A0A812UQZ1_9DINO|nr:Pomgnt1 [Symbiodinium necroappetens]
MLSCPLGMTLKRDDMIVWSNNEDDCCTTSAEDVADIGVRSAGWADGNEVVFFAAGKNFYVGSHRGLAVVTVRPDGSRKDAATFDTMASGSDALAAYIHSIENGTMVLIGAKDEASNNLTDTAKAAIKTCGATMIDGLSWRGAYALVGVKGGPALAEDIKRTTEGYAVAVGHMNVKAGTGHQICWQTRRLNKPAGGHLRCSKTCLRRQRSGSAGERPRPHMGGSYVMHA